VNFFQKKEKRQQEQRQTYIKSYKDRNLYVSNLDQTIDDERLKQAFAKYGHITSAKVKKLGYHS
jgi:polyadenylate-binding protein